jgi:Probable cobalt transporter subunit (CbtA)
MELVSRGVQSTIGLATAVVGYGVTIGGFFALIYAVAYGRLGRLSPRAQAAVPVSEFEDLMDSFATSIDDTRRVRDGHRQARL